jgi:hypothetical protein
MRSPKIESLKFLSLAAVLAGANVLAGCGGGGEAAFPATVVVNGPVALPMPPSPLPDPIPMPPDSNPGIIPPPEPPPEPPPVDVPPLLPDLRQARALAVAEGFIYVGDAAGMIWQLSPDGTQWVGWVNASDSAIEAMTYVPARQALYLVSGGQLLRVPLDTRVVELLFTTGFNPYIPNFGDVTGITWDTHNGGLYGLDRSQNALFVFDDIDFADTTFVMDVGFGHTDLQDLAFDRTEHPGRMIAVDATSQQLVEIDHLGLTSQDGAVLTSVSVRSLAMESPGVLVAVDNTWGYVVRFEPNGNLIP